MFDRYVQDKRRKRPLLYAAFVVSTAIEAGVLIFFIIYSLIHVEEVQPPPLTVQFFATTPPPPPPPPPPKSSSKPKTPPKVVKPVVQPTEVPKFIQPKLEPDPPEEKDTGGVRMACLVVWKVVLRVESLVRRRHHRRRKSRSRHPSQRWFLPSASAARSYRVKILTFLRS
jgi:outer membrane biosynthesis protein TonB